MATNNQGMVQNCEINLLKKKKQFTSVQTANMRALKSAAPAEERDRGKREREDTCGVLVRCFSTSLHYRHIAIFDVFIIIKFYYF